MLHGMIGGLSAQTGFVLLQVVLDIGQLHLLLFKIHLQIISPGKLVTHLILHDSDLVSHLLHFLVYSSLQSLDLVQVILTLLQLYFQTGESGFRVFQLTLLKSQV